MPVALMIRTVTTIDSIELDASVSESHKGDVDVTDHPIEDGSDIADHARAKPEMVTIEGFISNTPISTSQQTRLVQSKGFNGNLNFSLATTTLADQLQNGGYAETAASKLREIKNAAKLITVITELRTYDNMIMTSLDIPRNATVGDALRFTAGFKQVKLVQNKVTKVITTKEPSGQRNAKLGKQAAKPTTEQFLQYTNRALTRQNQENNSAATELFRGNGENAGKEVIDRLRGAK